jgi:membrane-associated protease RseP (regulator of RpoE activity)
VLAFSLPVIAYGVIFNLALAIVGGLFVLAAVFGWAMEPSMEHGHGDHGGDHGDGAEPDGDGTATAAPETEEATVG